MLDRIALACCLLIPCAATADLAVKPFKPSSIYALGEKAGWDIEPDSVQTEYRYTLRRNNLTVIGSGTLVPRQPARIEATLDEPAMLYVQIEDDDPATKDAALGAAIAPERLKPSVPEPRDFDRFWARKLRLLQKTPANPLLTPKESDESGVEYALLRMDHIEGRRIHGQVAKPARKGKFPGLVLFQWASPPYPLQQSWVTDRAAQGWLTVNIEPHDVLPDQPQSYYDALPQELKEYSNIGREDRDTNYFLQMYLADYRAIEYLAGRPDWDGKTLVVMGTSMGGQQGLCATALNPKVTALIVHVPSGADSNGPLHGRASGYPFWNATSPQMYRTALYFDTVNCAARVRAPTLVSLGFLDTISPPAGIYAAFNRIRGYKEVIPLADSPHNHEATAEQQAPYTRRSGEWLKILLDGGGARELRLRPE